MIVTFVFKYLLPFQVSMLKTFKFSHLVWLVLIDAYTLIWDHKLANLIRYGQNFTQNRGQRCLICFLLWTHWLLVISALYFSHNAPHQPTELAQAPWHRATDYLCRRREWRCTRAGERIDACSWNKTPALTCGSITLHGSFDVTACLRDFLICQ